MGVISSEELILVHALPVARLGSRRLKFGAFLVPDGRARWVLEMCRDTILTFSLPHTTYNLPEYHLQLRDPAGNRVRLEDFITTKSGHIEARNVPMSLSGRYVLELEFQTRLDGWVETLVKIRMRRRTAGEGLLSEDGPIRTTLGALPGSRVTLRVKAARGSSVDPVIASVRDADGTELLEHARIKAKGRVAIIRLPETSPGGDLEVVFRAMDGSSGQVRWKARVRRPRGYPYSVPDPVEAGDL